MSDIRTWIERTDYMGTIEHEDGHATVFMPRWFYVFALVSIFVAGFGLGWALT